MSTKKKKMGRPRIEFDAAKWEQFDGLCALQCTLQEIAEDLGVSEDTIERACKRTYQQTFADRFNQKRQRGFTSLRSKQFQKAMEGDVTTLIWLDKKYLGGLPTKIEDDVPEVYQRPEGMVNLKREGQE